MGNCLGSFVNSNPSWISGDYLTSRSGVYHAVLTSSGNLIVAHGAEPQPTENIIWQSGSGGVDDSHYALALAPETTTKAIFGVARTAPPMNDDGWTVHGIWPAGNFGTFQVSVRLEDDGSLTMYGGEGASAPNPKLWTNGASDPVVDVISIDSIDYDVANATISNPTPDGMLSQIVVNDTNRPQTSTISQSLTASDSSGWSDSLAVKVGVSTSLKTGIPMVAEGKVTISVDVTNTYTWNGSTSTTKTWAFSTPVTVDPNGRTKVLVVATTSTLTVPYTLSGTFKYQSGATLRGTISGLYTGTDTHDLAVTFTPVSASGDPVGPKRELGPSDFSLKPLFVSVG